MKYGVGWRVRSYVVCRGGDGDENGGDEEEGKGEDGDDGEERMVMVKMTRGKVRSSVVCRGGDGGDNERMVMRRRGGW